MYLDYRLKNLNVKMITLSLDYSFVLLAQALLLAMMTNGREI